MRILLIEDNPDLRDTLTDHLEIEHQVTPAKDGQEGWELFSENVEAFDTILTDIEMPRLNGLQLLQKIRMDSPEFPIIMMTGKKELEFSIKALQLGAFDFLPKPIQLRDLDQALLRLNTTLTSQQAVFQILPSITGKIECQIKSQYDLIDGVVAFFMNLATPFCQAHQVDTKKIHLCLIESMINAVVHGNLEVPSHLKENSWETFEQLIKTREHNAEYGEKEVLASLRMVPRVKSSAISLVFEIEDQGKGFNPQNLPDPNDPASLLNSGRGILLIRTFMDQVRWNEQGNCITMTKHFSS